MPRTPGGALKKVPKSDAQLKSVERSEENPCKDTFTLDSFATDPGTTNDVNRNFTRGIGLDI